MSDREDIFTGSFMRTFLLVPGSSAFDVGDPPDWDDLRVYLGDFVADDTVNAHVRCWVDIHAPVSNVTTGVEQFDMVLHGKRTLNSCVASMAARSRDRQLDGNRGLILRNVWLSVVFNTTRTREVKVQRQFQQIHIKRGGIIKIGQPI